MATTEATATIPEAGAEPAAASATKPVAEPEAGSETEGAGSAEGSVDSAADLAIETTTVDAPMPHVPTAGGDTAQAFEFDADIHQVLSIIINAIYSNNDVFLRELISNSSDAIDKIRHRALTEPDALGELSDLKIDIIPDKENNRLIVRDTGCGMTKSELIKNLGTVARSGTKQFVQAMAAGSDISMIGQFGVGFYSAFLVSDRVTVVTKSPDDEQYIWSSAAGGTFTVEQDTGPNIGRGTMVILYLKDDDNKYLEEYELRNLVKKHSQYVSYPINLRVCKEEEQSETDDEADEAGEDKDKDKEDDDEDKDKEDEDEDKDKADEDKDKDEDEEGKVESDEDDETKAKPRRRVMKKLYSFEHVNTAKPLWMRNPEDVTHEEYAEFYKQLSVDWEDHLAVAHFSKEGQLQFRALLFIPPRAPFDLFHTSKSKTNIKLYVRRVFITDTFNDPENSICPEWLGFVQGVVDSDDLPLNVSRETLQQSRVLRSIRRSVVAQCLSVFEKLAEDEEKFGKLYKAFSKNLKLGVHEDAKNRDRLVRLLRYYTTKSGDAMCSLQDYVDRMPEGQKKIYYIIGESREAIVASPFLERLDRRGYEVVLMTDAIDEYAVQQIKKFGEYELQNVTKEGLDLAESDEDKARFEKQKEAFKPLLAKMAEILGDEVEKVELSNRVITSPCVLVTSKYGWSANMQRVMQAQALGSSTMQWGMSARKIMEVNPDHPISVRLLERFGEDAEDPTVKELVQMIYQTALLASGFSVQDPSAYAGRIYSMMGFAVDADMSDLTAQADEIAAAADAEADEDAEVAGEADAEAAAEVDDEADDEALEALD